MENSKQNNLALDNLNDKLLALMKYRCIISSYLLSPLSKITNPENTTQFKIVIDHNSNRVNDMLMKSTTTFILHDSWLAFRDTGKVFKLEGELLKMITNQNFIIDHASLSHKKLMYDYAKEMHFDK